MKHYSEWIESSCKYLDIHKNQILKLEKLL